MGKKRKRSVKDDRTQEETADQHQPATGPSGPSQTYGNPGSDAAEVSHPVISLYYRRVVTLRQYILQRIPRSSKSRRRRIAAVRSDDVAKAGLSDAPTAPGQDLARLLDTTLVGILEELSPAQSQERRQDFIAYTQAQLTSQFGTDTGPMSPQSDIVNYVISSVFNRCGFSYQGPQHLLSHGFCRESGRYDRRTILCSIPGIEAQFPNKNVQILKQAPWTEVLALLGNDGDKIMSDLLLDCGIFVAVDAKKGIYYQISGKELSALDPIPNLTQEDSTGEKESPLPAKNASVLAPIAKTNSGAKPARVEKDTQLAPNAIVFCRRRMLYARPHLNNKGRIEFGLPKHILNRFPSSQSLQQTVRVLNYVFPRQFGLHNVFMTEPRNRESALSKNYTSRENEIAEKETLRVARYQRRTSGLSDAAVKRPESIKIPKRLRGKALELVRQLQNRNKRCSYKELLHHYCPEECASPWTLGPLSVESGTPASELASSCSVPLITQHIPQQRIPQSSNAPATANLDRPSARLKAPNPKVNLTDYATPAASVSAFCRAVIRKLIPPEFFGTGEQKISHRKIILGHVDKFTRMRRFESLSLHEVCKGIKITQIPWLEPHGFCQVASQSKVSGSDFQKRKELFHEFVYYIFGSILMPLIRGNFYVTESQANRNRLFYFRHDVWRRITTQPLANLKSSMFEELRPEVAQSILGRRLLTYGSLRLLPKTTGIRPILNLRRRTLMKNTFAGKTRYTLGPSVNSTIAPIHSMLNYEKGRRVDLLGSAMCSVGDMHSRLKAFKESMMARGWNQSIPLYFVKLDIQSCFDAIPQQNLLCLIEKLVSGEAYRFMKYVEMRPGNEFNNMWPQRESEQNKTRRKFIGKMAPLAKPEHLIDVITNGNVTGRRNTVFIDTVSQKEHSGEALLDLLDEHVRNNLVKIGKRYFRQRNGIPQGSVLSSLLCNLFYAEMERDVLGFLQSDEALLLRLIDDFLLITSDPGLAMRFLCVMISGQPAYGISVNPAKSLVNFAASVDGAQIPRLIDTPLFPYCGSLIDTQTLEIFKDQDRILDGAESVTAALTDSLTIESARAPGRSFHRKVLASIKLSMHPMYLDTAHNSYAAVLCNLYTTLVTSAMKMYRYIRSLPGRAHPRQELIVRTIRDVIQLGYRLIRGGRCQCMVTYSQMKYLVAAAFQFVLGRKQTRYAGVVRWLDGVVKEARWGPAENGVLLAQAVRRGNLTYAGWRF